MTSTALPRDCPALILVDLQNDFLTPDGAYGRAGQASPALAALPAKIAPLAAAVRACGGLVIASQFTLIPGRGGEPIISAHLRRLRPFLTNGDFASGTRGHAVVDALKPIDVLIEKIAYSAFYMTRLEWVLRKLSVSELLVCGIVTNGGVASTVRDAHVRDFAVTVIEDACAAFTPALHSAAIEGLRPIARITTLAEVLASLNPGGTESIAPDRA